MALLANAPPPPLQKILYKPLYTHTFSNKHIIVISYMYTHTHTCTPLKCIVDSLLLASSNKGMIILPVRETVKLSLLPQP